MVRNTAVTRLNQQIFQQFTVKLRIARQKNAHFEIAFARYMAHKIPVSSPMRNRLVKSTCSRYMCFTDRVVDVRWAAAGKELWLKKRASPIRVSRSACVSVGDIVVSNDSGVAVECSNGAAKILPVYATYERLQIGNLALDLLIKEITDVEEFAAFRSLSEYQGARTLKGILCRILPDRPKSCGSAGEISFKVGASKRSEAGSTVRKPCSRHFFSFLRISAAVGST